MRPTMPATTTPRRTDRTDEFENDDYAAALARYAGGESDLGDAADSAGVSRWEFVERLRETGVEFPGLSSELA